MADNTDEEHADNPTTNQSENFSDESVPAIDREGISSNQETEHMEVHHHAHDSSAPHHRKNWKSYFWEFLMLFLAVFCGFLAEYKLEHVIEHQREKQYVQSLIEDLKNDQVVLSRHITTVQNSALMLDTLVNILNNPVDISKRTGDLYYLVRLAPRLKPLSTNTRTFEQLKNSGNFRLIRNLETSNKIMAYYEKLPLIHLLENINETEFTEYKKVAAKIFNPAVFIKMEGKNDEIMRSFDNPSLRSTDTELLQELSVFAVYLHGTRKGIVGSAEEFKNSGDKLLKYLQEEYKTE